MSTSRIIRRIGAAVGFVTVIPFVTSLAAIPASAATAPHAAPAPAMEKVQAAPTVPNGSKALGASTAQRRLPVRWS
ncbi:MAG TPA: hypothetical protein VGL49_06470 [Acidimicrobiales bacterium]